MVRGETKGRVLLEASLQVDMYRRVRNQEVNISVVEPLVLRPALPVVLAPGASLQYAIYKVRLGAETRTSPLLMIWMSFDTRS